MTKCDFCKYKYSWYCDNGKSYPENGCESFSLDEGILTEREKRLLIIFNIIKENKYDDWYL